ncbi:MAG: DNA sulfur modification protein DndB [Candidatus Gastranaerophilales bacterium]|nr:DNA sulfur modification protein DndB [Candidatus Gastranaerophilales bacterium]
MEFTYKFSAVKGIQANQQYYISMVPLKYLSKLFKEELDVPLPEHRSQRRINELRIPEIKKYILDNRNNYIFSALASSIDGHFVFKPIPDNENIGILEIDMDARFLINDGQHRLAAINEALGEDESLLDETISIVFFKDEGLYKSQQMFTDLNKHAVKTSNSLSTLYDSRDELAVVTREVINRVSFLNLYTDKEKDILGKNSSKLFTLNNLYKANYKILRKKNCSKKDEEFLCNFWNELSSNVCEWQELINKNITKKDLRENYIVTLAVTLNAFGKLGAYFYDTPSVDMHSKFKKMQKINWSRACKENWYGRTIRNDGKIKNNDEAVFLTCNKIKELLSIAISKEDKMKEIRILEKGN